jgi:5,10-methylenetetrahydromethanopterin reductase
MRFSFEVIPEQPTAELLDAIELADQLGFHGCYSADETYHKDMWTLFAAAAGRTERIVLAPGVTHVILKDPTLIAQQAATLDELTGGRTEVVFSVGNIAMLEQYGIEWRPRMLARLREAHHVLRTFLDAGEIDFAGDFYSYRGLFTAARPVQKRLPVKLGGMGGPKSFQLAGEISDGLHTACAYSPEAVGYAVEHAHAGAEKAGRDPSDIEVADYVLGAIAPHGDAARTAARALAAFYIPSMPPVLLERHGIAPESVQPILDAFGRGDVAEALRLTSDDLADRISIAGTPDDWVERLRADVVPSGLDHLVVVPADPFLTHSWAGVRVDGLPDLAGQLRLLHDEVMPALA